MDSPSHPASLPPPGVTSNFANPSNDAALTVAIGASTIALATFFLLARLYSNIRFTRSIGPDDYVCVLATIFSAGYLGLQIHAKYYDRHTWDAPMSAISTSYIRIIFASTMLFNASIFLAKLSLLILLTRLFSPNRRFRSMVYLGIAISSLLFLTTLTVAAIVWTPRHGQDPTSSAAIARYETFARYAIVQGSFNVVLDFYILYLPIPILWKLQLRRKTRIGVTAIFITGLIACMASILGLVYRIKSTIGTDLLWNNSKVDIANILETNVAIICSCMPAFAAFSKHTASHTRSYLQLRSRPNADRFSDKGRSHPVEKLSRLAVPPTCYTVSQARGQDKTFLTKTLLKSQVREGDVDRVASSLPNDAANGGGIVQSLEVEITVSPNLVRGGDQHVLSFEQAVPSTRFPKAALRDEHVGLIGRSKGREEV